MVIIFIHINYTGEYKFASGAVLKTNWEKGVKNGFCEQIK